MKLLSCAIFQRFLMLFLLVAVEESRAGDKRVFMILWRGETRVEASLRDALAGESIELISRSIDRDPDRIADYVAEAKALRPDLVYSWGTTVTRNVVGPYDAINPKHHITDLPVVFVMVAYPVQSKLVPDFSGSGRNITGLTHSVPLEAQIRVLRSYRPLKRLAAIYNPNENNSIVNIRELRSLAKRFDFELIALPVPLDEKNRPMSHTLPGLVTSLAARDPEFLYIGPDNFIGSHHKIVVGEAFHHAIPAFTATELELREGQAMVGLVTRYDNLGRFAAYRILQILKEGADPGQIPITSLRRFTLAIRMPVARALNLYPPMHLLRFAEIINE